MHKFKFKITELKHHKNSKGYWIRSIIFYCINGANKVENYLIVSIHFNIILQKFENTNVTCNDSKRMLILGNISVFYLIVKNQKDPKKKYLIFFCKINSFLVLSQRSFIEINSDKYVCNIILTVLNLRFGYILKYLWIASCSNSILIYFYFSKILKFQWINKPVKMADRSHCY